MKIIALNKRATHDYEILERFEAGIVLNGNEIKSVRSGKVQLTDSFAIVKDGELLLLNCHITPYSHAAIRDDNATRTRHLLMHRREIDRLEGAISRKGLTIVTLKMYLNGKNYAKVEIATARHKKLIDKRESLKSRDLKREASRDLKINIK